MEENNNNFCQANNAKVVHVIDFLCQIWEENNNKLRQTRNVEVMYN